jgi:CheY-like chemotaxis protein
MLPYTDWDDPVTSEIVENTNIIKAFGDTVKSRRNLVGISQEELAERADLHRTYVSDVERGARNVSLKNITRIAQALGVSTAELFPPELFGEKANKESAKKSANEFVDILLVEDDLNDVELTLHAFKQARFANRIQVVTDGAEALDYLFFQGRYAKQRPASGPQVILLDLQLPKVGGMEVLRRLRADKRTALTPVVILTTSKSSHDVAECRRLGADNYIIKPVNFQRLSVVTPQLNLSWALLKTMAVRSAA